MAQAGIAAGPFGGNAISRVMRLAARHIRITVLLCIVLICGTFAAASTLQMQIGRERALRQAATLELERTREIAGGLGARLDRSAKVASLFAADQMGNGNAEAFLSAHPSALRNVAVVDDAGHLLKSLKQPDFRVMPSLLARAAAGRVVTAYGPLLLIAFPQNGAVTVAELNFDPVFPGAVLSHNAMTDTTGKVLASGNAWTAETLPNELSQADGAALSSGQVVTSATVPGWPLRVGGTLDAGEAVGAWYGSLPLYLFVILGPAIAGAWLAVVFVREFEKRARASDALAKLRNTSSSDARLLIRLAEAERRASEAERAKSEFVAHMSHELRTPLNAIIGFSEIISHGFFGQPGHPKYIEYARDIGSAGRELHGKIGDILEYANVEAERHPITLAPVDVAALASACVEEMTGRAFSRRIELGVVTLSDTRAMADGSAVKRVLSNLLCNALNFTPDGGNVRVEIVENDRAVIARVRDTGRGFSEDEASRAGEAFATFERVGSVTGLGLGLAIATALAERMGGEMVLVRNQAMGTTAELRLRKV
ncbi:MAG TPA: HAMP domain-containing sensor histidine kinase [Rhizomicrobium sp.]|nr:HAMP domain-containing sensor histidine kinase [Rhizomicrobium sp.]